MTGRKWAYKPVNKDLKCTYRIYEDPDKAEHYDDERTVVHDYIIKRALKGAKAMKKPFALVVAGGPTCGKSTLITALRRNGVLPTEGIVTINKMPFSQLPEYSDVPDARHPEKMWWIIDEYWDLLHYIIKEATEKKLPIIIEEHG